MGNVMGNSMGRINGLVRVKILSVDFRSFQKKGEKDPVMLTLSASIPQ